MDENLADIAVIGLAVMGQNLALNINDHNFKVAVFNRTVSKVDEFLLKEAKDTKIIAAHSIEELVSKLKKPRKILLMVKAGEPVDENINQLVPLLEYGDIIIDGGNSNYLDTTKRMLSLKEKGIKFIGTGISGGEEGARNGPSIMPGGSIEAWEDVKPILTQIAAKGLNDEPCCDWIGPEGSGHFVKIVHNGIEYGDMELIAETYSLLKNVLKLNNDKMAAIFNEWNSEELESYLIEITSLILSYKEGEDFIVDKILDSAGQKGTGKWTVIAATDEGQPLSVIYEAVNQRFISTFNDQRTKASQIFNQDANSSLDTSNLLNDIRKALYLAKIISYCQGFSLIKNASVKYKWGINLSNVAQVWTGGCVIRSKFLKDIKQAYISNPELENILFDDFFVNIVKENINSLRNVIKTAVDYQIPVPCYSSSLSYFDSFKSERLPANIIQAQRDVFGAHTYERIDKNRGEFFHTNWSGKGGDTTSGTYNV